ncbi:uncharacterized protein [Typha angustifolia]|uniref:uncharacterized protein n=1 Tax=Typha angustifolia TaxID=59011 RepID=UPI003C2C71BD
MTDMQGSSSTVADIAALHKEWDEASCPICMDHPHNAVLLICSSHEKGCRTYICDTSYRHSNCLDRFKKVKADNRDSSQASSSFHENSGNGSLGPRAHNSVISEPLSGSPTLRRSFVATHEDYIYEDNTGQTSVSFSGALEESNNNQEPERSMEAQVQERVGIEESGGHASESNTLKCPLCRGTVISWIIVKEARQYLDQKSRACSRESCMFFGNYRELRRHARRVHPTTRPADADQSRQRSWHRLEHQREYGDILSAIRSAMPGAIVIGDYVIDNRDELSHDHENTGSGEGDRPSWATFFLFHMVSSPIRSLDEARSSSRAWRTHRRTGHRNLWGENLLGLQDDDGDGENLDDDIPVPRRRRRFMRSRSDEDHP